MLHITNGDAAVGCLQAAGLDDELLAWRDVLHEGPVPAGLSLDRLRPIRARFISDQGWAVDEQSVLADFARRDEVLQGYSVYNEVVLWFEHDLYDQLQLIQLLDWFAQHELRVTRLSAVVTDQYLGTLVPEVIQALFDTRKVVTRAQLQLGQRAWAAFCSPDPRHIESLLQTDCSALPFLAAALYRHLEQFPSVEDGLSRSEAQALAVVAQGRRPVRDVYVAAHSMLDDPVFLGDTIFAWYLESMSEGARPLLLCSDGQRIQAPRYGRAANDFWSASIELTPEGHAVLAGQQDRVALRGIDRWLGGVHLENGAAVWRWNRTTQRLQLK